MDGDQSIAADWEEERGRYAKQRCLERDARGPPRPRPVSGNRSLIRTYAKRVLGLVGVVVFFSLLTILLAGPPKSLSDFAWALLIVGTVTAIWLAVTSLWERATRRWTQERR